MFSYNSAKNADSISAPKARIPIRFDRSSAAMSVVEQLPRRIQMTLGGWALHEAQMMEVRVF